LLKQINHSKTNDIYNRKRSKWNRKITRRKKKWKS
jgi:hypothetical protein